MATITILKTGGVVIGGTTVVGATGYGAYSLIKPKNIKEQLEWDEEKILSLEEGQDKEKWEELAERYPNSKPFKDLTSLSASDKAEKGKELQEKCKEVLKQELNNSTEVQSQLTAAREWCTHKKTTVAKP